MNINSSNYFSVSASSNRGVSGLISGMDTEGMVEKMLSGVQNQIDKQKALQKQSEWKQGIYQDIIGQINSFSSKYFDSSYASGLLNNLTSADFFNSKISKVTSGNAVSIVGSAASALQGDMSIVVSQLAEAASITGNNTGIGAGNNTITGAKIDAAFLEKNFGNKLNLTLSSTTYDDVADPDHENPIVTETAIEIDFSGVTTATDALALLTSKISDVGGTFSGSINEGTLSMEVGNNQTLTVEDTSSNLLLKRLGLAGLVGLDMQTLTGTTRVDLEAKPSSVFTVTFDGVSKVITMDDLADSSGAVTADSLEVALSKQIKTAFGDYVSVGRNADNQIVLTMNTGGEKGHQLTITGSDCTKFGIEAGASTSITTSTKLSALGATPGQNVDGADVYLFSINGQEFTLGADKTVGDLIIEVNKSDAGVTLGFSALTGQFNLTSTRTGSKFGIELGESGGDLMGKIFGDALGVLPARASGKDASLLINGVATSRDSNQFTVDGITLKLNQISAGGEATVIGTAQDSDKVVAGIKSFVDDYNVLVEKIHDYLKADASYRDFKPLTDAQRKELSEKEIEDWEEKAQEGLLRNDPTLSGFLQAMRSILYMKPDSSNLALYDIGIETSGGIIDQYGKLKIDETKLRNAISSDPTSVANLFSARDYAAKDDDSTKQGIAQLLSKTIDNYAKVSSGSPGILVQMAGVKESSTYKTQNFLYVNLQKIKARIEDLQEKYEKDRQRYWNQFNSMETALASFNSQSAMISQQFSGGY